MKKLLCAFLALCFLYIPAFAEETQLIFHGDWDEIEKTTYQREMADLFYSTYPRLYARWGTDNTPTTIYYKADKEDHKNVAYSYANRVVVSVDYANKEPLDLGFFSHELTHCVQGYSGKLVYGGDAWWTENMANYGGFRYYHWADASHLEPEPTDFRNWIDWEYAPYGNCQWFFAYMDDQYPTHLDENGSLHYGLIDSVHHLILSNTGEELDDDPYDPETPINKVVYSITGYESFEALRIRFADDLESGLWTFQGFSNYKDNFLTENLPGVKNPDYPSYDQVIPKIGAASSVGEVPKGTNLLKGAKISGASGFVNESETPGMLVDGNFLTKWCSTPESIDDKTHLTDGAKQWIQLDLGEEKAFNTYTIVNTRYTEPYYGNMVSWKLLTSIDGQNWTLIDNQEFCDKDIATFDVGDQSARYLLLKMHDPDNGERGTIRLYEMMLFYSQR
ncbi:MAG: discoidin domain-containing protein [Clostridia bacterium]|nr:discoidin domain-containing protein [Clostridia bacterium]